MFETDNKGFFLYVNKFGLEFLGYNLGELLLMTIFEIVVPDEKPDLMKHFQLIADNGFVNSFCHAFKRKDGSRFPGIIYYSPMTLSGNRIGARGIIADVSVLNQKGKKCEQQDDMMHADKDKLNVLSNNAPFGMILIDRDGRFTYVNNKFREMFGYDLSDIPDGKMWFRKAYPDKQYRAKVISAWMEDFRNPGPGEKKPRTFAVTCKDKTKKIISFVTVELATRDYLITCEDVTELKRLEAELVQSQKMQAIGNLAAGIAHDFNNILSVIMGYSNLMQMKLHQEDPIRRYADQVVLSSEKAATLTQSLLAFSRPQKTNIQPVELNAFIVGSKKLLSRLLTEDIGFEIIPSEKDATVMADRVQIEQILINLVSNAKDTIADKGGKVTIGVDTTIIGDEFIRSHGFGKEGAYAVISCTDNGVGMDGDIAAHMFEPFFANNNTGRKGVGLGLSIVYSIVMQHEGYIRVESEPFKGTGFYIYIPLAEQANFNEMKKTNASLSGGNEKILLAEDDPSLRVFAKGILEDFGYLVIDVANGEEAVRLFNENADSIDLLFLDVVMPGMNGREVYDVLHAVRPDIKVLFSSGYTEDVIHTRGLCEGYSGMLKKPFSLEELLNAVSEALGKQR